MPYSIIKRFLVERNWWIEYRLRQRAGLPFATRAPFVCHGSIQLEIAWDATIVPPAELCQIGLLALATTAKQTTTTLSLKSKAISHLNGVFIGRGTKVSCNTGARLSIGRGTYVTDGSMVAASMDIRIGT